MRGLVPPWPWIAPVLLSLSACFVDSIGLERGAGGIAEGGSGATGLGGDADGGRGGGGGSEAGAGGAGGDGGAGGSPANVCGDGALGGAETCDTGRAASDGCVACVVTPGWECADEPSVCNMILAISGVATPEPAVSVNDTANHYDGTLATMDCVNVDIADGGYTSVVSVVAELAVNHAWVGDLIIKVVPPAGTPIATVLNRSGAAEASDDYNESPNGYPPELHATSPITFDVNAPNDAEQMGAGLGDTQVVCADDLKCAYFPNPGTAVGQGLVDLVGAAPAGTWRVCFADGDDGDAGQVVSARLTVLAW